MTRSEHAAQLARVPACEQRDYHQHDVYADRPTVEAPKLTPTSMNARQDAHMGELFHG